MEEHCEWDQWGDDYNTWDTSCGQAQCFIEGNINDNSYKFCPYCGKPIKEISNNEVIDPLLEQALSK